MPFMYLIVLPIAFAFRRRGRWPLILMVGLIGLMSCAGAGGGGGGGTTTAPNQGTPAGTYSVVVTASANGISHKTTITLIVD